MDNGWKISIEDGVEYWVNDELGGITKLSDGAYVCLVPKVIKLGIFSSLEDAQLASKLCKEQKLDLFVEKLNEEVKEELKKK